MSNLTNHNPKIQIVCGPTGSGKTAFAFKLAGDKPTSIISADSRQIYQGLDIITGKDIPVNFEKKISSLTFNNRPIVYYTPPVIPNDLGPELFESEPEGSSLRVERPVEGVEGPIRLWGLDLLSPDEVYNAGEFSLLIRQIIDREVKESRQVFVVGGSGFYLKALVYPESLSSVIPNDKLRQELNLLTVEELAQRLRELDLQRFISLNQSDVNNPHRLIRAIEIVSSGSSSELAQFDKFDQSYVFTWLGIRIPMPELQHRIESRVLTRLDRGAIVEVENLLRSYPDQNLPVYTILGIKPIIKFINKEIDLPTLIKTWVLDEVNYAKRQITWFKKQPDILWYDQT